MTPDDLDLARRLVLHERFEWRGGMRAFEPGYRDLGVWLDASEIDSVGPDDVLDIHDAATGGVLFDMLREAAHYHNPTLRWESETQWYRVDIGAEKWFGPTVGIAAAQALLEVWS